MSADPDTIEAYPHALPYPDGNTLVIFKEIGTGMCYQIIDQYGNLVYEDGQPLIPQQNGVPTNWPILIADGSGGAFAAWATLSFTPYPGIFAQHLDSLGNRLWGDSGVRISPFADIQFDVCADSQGGMWLAVTPGQVCGMLPNVYVQRVDAQGNLTFDPQGLVAIYSPLGVRYPSVAPDGQGGCFILWEDFRTWTGGSIFAQHLNGNGVPQWSQDLHVCNNAYAYYKKVIPDGEGGILVQANFGGPYNTHWRIDGSGNILWTRTQLSWWYWAEMVSGESGFFYLVFLYDGFVRGQRVDLNGNNHWQPNGAPMVMVPQGMTMQQELTAHYRYPYLYGGFPFHTGTYHMNYLYVQALDSLGNRMMEDRGALLAVHINDQFAYTDLVADEEGGAIMVWQKNWDYDIYAKRCNADGSLGGPSWPPPQVHLPLGEIQGFRVEGGMVLYTLPGAGRVEVELFDLLGRRVARLEEGYRSAGSYGLRFDDRVLASGVYVVKISGDFGSQLAKTVILK